MRDFMMRKCQMVFRIFLAVALVGMALYTPHPLAAQADSSQVCDQQRSTAVDGKASERKILACDDFMDGQPGRWTASHGVSASDISNGKLELSNRHEDQRPGAEQTTQVVYVLGEQSGDVTVEAKFDDFALNPNSRFIIEMQAAPGNALDIGRWSAGGKQYLQFQVIGSSQSRVATQVDYNHSSGVLKTHYAAATGQLQAFYKQGPGDSYTEMPGSPYQLPEFKKGPYLVVLYSHNFNNAGGPASVKLDWVKITGPATDQAGGSAAASSPARPQPRRPADFKPFHFRYSTEDLRQKFSDEVMKRASRTMARANHVIDSGPYKPTWASLDGHQLPEWFKDAKFGMFIDWGLYSVPAYAPTGYPDWYLHRMIYGDTKKYHEEVWGKDFHRDDFIPLFAAAQYDPELLAKVAEAGGMKYVIPFAKHHDGFALWPSSFTFRNAAQMGPKRDLIGPLAEACRKRGLKFGFYFSLDEWEYPVIQKDGKLAVRMWDTEPRFKVHEVPYSPQEFAGKISGKVPMRDFYNDYINAEAIEFIDKYDPDIIWFDGDWVVGADERNSRSIVAYFYGHSRGRKEVAVNDRMGLVRSVPTAGQEASAKPHGDFYTSEYMYEAGSNPQFRHYWEETNGLSSSFGYNWQETNDKVRSADDVVRMLVDVVSTGGNLLLITNLTSDGKLDPLLAERLDAVGTWLKTNGEAIYATRQWKQAKQGEDVRFTQSKDGKQVYAIVLKWPGDSLTLQAVHPRQGSQITMLGRPSPLQWHQDGDAVVIELPKDGAAKKAAASGWAFRIQQEAQ